MQAVQLSNQPLPPALASALASLQNAGDAAEGVTSQASPEECDSGYTSVGGSDTPSGAKSSSPSVTSAQVTSAGDVTVRQAPVYSRVNEQAMSNQQVPGVERMRSVELCHSTQTLPVSDQHLPQPPMMTPHGVPMLTPVKDEPMTSHDFDVFKYSNSGPPKLEPVTPEDLPGCPLQQSPCDVSAAPHLPPDYSQQQELPAQSQQPSPELQRLESSEARRYRSTAEPNSLGALQGMIADARVAPHGDHLTLVVDVTASIIDAHMGTCIWTTDLRAEAFQKFEDFQRKRQEQQQSSSTGGNPMPGCGSGAPSAMGSMLSQTPPGCQDGKVSNMWSTLVKGMVPVITRVIEFSKRLPGKRASLLFFHELF